MSKQSKVQWKSLEAKETEPPARVLFGEPSKVDHIWPSDVIEALPEDLRAKLIVKEKKIEKKIVTQVQEEADLDMDDLIEQEWG